jgi:hypothetical protein
MATFPAIRIEGGLLGPDVLDQLLAAELPGQKPADFGLDGRRKLTDEIAAVFADARALWQVFQHRLQRLPGEDLATSVTRDAWGIPFLGLLGYEPRYSTRALEVDGPTFALSHRAGDPDDTPPLHVVGARQELGRVAASGRQRLAPHSLVQEYLNRTEHLWGIVTNGLTLRLLRDSTFVRRQAYVEFDLTAILEESRFQDFAALYRLLHCTRLPRGMADAGDCLLETYYAHSVEQGGRVREHLRDGVEECIKSLAYGFLRHPANDKLCHRVSPACVGNEHISAEDLYRQLLRLVYRFLFLLVSEDRGLLSPDPIYREHYGIARLRRLLESHAAPTDHDDLWQSLRVLWKVLSDEKLAAFLNLAPLNGELFTPQDLDAFTITNRDLLDAFWHLTWYQEHSGSSPHRERARRNREERAGQMGLFAWNPGDTLADLIRKSRALDAIADDTPEAIKRKKQLFEQKHAGPAWLRQKEACDLWSAAFFQPLKPDTPAITSGALSDHLRGRPIDPRLLAQASVLSMRQKFFHWPLEFPEVFADGGFDVVLSNPPWEQIQLDDREFFTPSFQRSLLRRIWLCANA